MRGSEVEGAHHLESSLTAVLGEHTEPTPLWKKRKNLDPDLEPRSTLEIGSHRLDGGAVCWTPLRL